MTKRKYDTNGFFEVKDNPISKEGVFQYLGSSVGATGADKDKIFNVYRPAKELKKLEAIKSFKLIPLVDDHTMLGKDETPAEQKGVHGVTGEEIYFKDGILYANLKIFSEALKNLIENGKKELSLGYYCKYIFEKGVFDGQDYDVIQTDMIGNHLALVNKGRMGDKVAVQDSLNFTIGATEMTKEEMLALLKEQLTPLVTKMTALDEAIKAKDEEKKDEKPDEKKPDEKKEGEKKAEDEKPDEKKEPEKKETKDEEPNEKEKLKSQIDEMKKKLADMEKNKAQDALDIKQSFMKETAEKTKLADELSKHIGTFDHLDKDLQGVVKYGLEKLSLSPEKGQELATLKGFLAGAKNSIATTATDSAEDFEISSNPYDVFK